MFLGRTDIGRVMTDKSESTSVSDDAKVLPKRQGSGWIKDPHDTFFGTVFSIPSCAYSFVRDQLPDKIVELLADQEPRIIESSFFGDDLSKSKADLLMEVEMASGESGFIYVLVEHKSYQDGGSPLQMLGYMVRIWQKYARDGKDLEGRTARERALPPIIPVLGYTGKQPWSGPRNFADMIATDDPNLVFLRGSDLVIREWAQMPPGELSRDPLARAALLTLTERGPAHFEEVEEALQDNSPLQDQFADYIRSTTKGEALDILDKKIADAKAKHKAGQKESVMGRMMENLIDEGRVEGRVEGEVRGIAKGEAKSLTRLLERRFGPLPAAIKSRIDGADLNQLDAWIDRVLDAKSLDAMFAAAK